MSQFSTTCRKVTRVEVLRAAKSLIKEDDPDDGQIVWAAEFLNFIMGVVFTWGWMGVGRVRGLRVRGRREGGGSVVMLLGIVRDCSWAR